MFVAGQKTYILSKQIQDVSNIFPKNKPKNLENGFFNIKH